MQQPWLYIIMLIAGVGIPIMAALNTALGQHIQNPIGAVAILSVVAVISSVFLLVITGKAIDWTQIITAPPLYFAAGCLFVFYLGSITYIAPKIGLGHAVLMVLIGQLVCSTIIDHFGLFGAQSFPITNRRTIGFSAVVLGFWLIVYK